MNVDYSPPVHEIPHAHRSVGLRCYASGFKRALGLFLSGRELHDQIEEIDRVTRHITATLDLSAPVDTSGQGNDSLLERLAKME